MKWFVMNFENSLFVLTAVITHLKILKSLLSSCFDINDDEGGMAMDILFKL